MAYNFLKNKRILITCGPTWIPIDDTRIISNISTGQLGQMMAIDLQEQGGKVSVLEGAVAARLKSKKITVTKFHYYDEFAKLIKKELSKRPDIIIHAAAVSDYQLKRTFKTKLSSNLKQLNLTLKPTQKIINTIKRLSPRSILVGFKLVSRLNDRIAYERSRPLFEKAGCDLVIVNSSKNNKYLGYIVDACGCLLAQAHSREQISKQLVNLLKGIK